MSGELSDYLKQANVSPIFKNDDPLDQENYRPACILPSFSQEYDKLLFNKLSGHVENIFNVIFAAFEKSTAYNTHCLSYYRRGKRYSNEKDMVATVLMDLSMAYDCIPHDLLLAKLNAQGVDSVGLLLISDYFSCRKQRTKIGSFCSFWYDIIRRVPQESKLGPFLKYLSMTYFSLSESLKFVTLQTIIHSIREKILRIVISNLRADLIEVMQWFKLTH